MLGMECLLFSRERFMKRQKKKDGDMKTILDELKSRGSPSVEIYRERQNEYLRHIEGKHEII